MIEYPILQILIFLSLLFAPLEADRVFIDGMGTSAMLRRDGASWTLTQNGQTSTVSLAGDTLVTLRDGQEERLSLADHVGPVLRHDWTIAPKLALHEATTLEKTATGFILRTHAGTSKERPHLIYFAKPGEIRVNVIGSVNSPQTCILPADATLLHAIAAAGGRSRLSNRDQVRLIRRSDGEKTETTTIATKPMELGETTGPALQDNDVIVVPEICNF